MCGRIRQRGDEPDYFRMTRWDPAKAFPPEYQRSPNVPPGTRPLVLHRLGDGSEHVCARETAAAEAASAADALAKAAALGDDSGANVITSYLADKGTSLSDAFTEWTVANLTGGYSAPGLKGLAPATYATPALTGSTPHAAASNSRPDGMGGSSAAGR